MQYYFYFSRIYIIILFVQAIFQKKNEKAAIFFIKKARLSGSSRSVRDTIIREFPVPLRRLRRIPDRGYHPQVLASEDKSNCPAGHRPSARSAVLPDRFPDQGRHKTVPPEVKTPAVTISPACFLAVSKIVFFCRLEVFFQTDELP